MTVGRRPQKRRTKPFQKSGPRSYDAVGARVSLTATGRDQDLEVDEEPHQVSPAKRFDEPCAFLEESSLPSGPIAEIQPPLGVGINAELDRAPQRKLSLDGRQEPMKRLPEPLADSATDVLAEPGRADRGAMTPDAALTAALVEVVWTSHRPIT